MARFKSIVTDAGAAALTALIAAGKPLILTHAAAGSGVATVSPNTLTGIVTPENVAVSLGEKDLIEGDPAIMRIPVQVTNEGLDAPVWIREVAVYAKPLEYGFRGHFVPGHWDGKSFVYQPKDPQGGMFVHSLIPGHYTLERAVNATKRTQNARLQRRFEQELKKRGYMKYFK